jgi:hypothetical protein
MNVPVELIQLQEFLWNQVQEVIQREYALSALASFVGELVRGTWLPLAVALVLLSLVALLYQPRIPRGALWIPVFGIFGGMPRFYTHTRPASFCGIFLKPRHRVTTRYRRRPHQSKD